MRNRIFRKKECSLLEQVPISEVDFNTLAVRNYEGTEQIQKFDVQKSCELDYESGLKKIKEIWIGDDLVWQDGARISQMTMDVYNARHPYMGDASANVETANMLKISEKIGGFTNELDSSGDGI